MENPLKEKLNQARKPAIEQDPEWIKFVEAMESGADPEIAAKYKK